jgi:hypothetical protein
MFERRVSIEDIEAVIDSGETIKDYPDDSPYPSRLVLGWRGARPLHVVVADNSRENELVVITVYEPDPEFWEDDFRRRRP